MILVLRTILKRLRLKNRQEEVCSELIEFADRFSKMSLNTKAYKGGSTYLSKNSKYTLRYYPLLLDNHTRQEVSTPARVGRTTGTIEISERKFLNKSKDYLYYTVIWCGLHMKYNFDLLKTDLAAINHYLKTKRPVIDVLNGIMDMFIGSNATEQNKIRFQEINKFIGNYYNQLK